VLLAWLVLRGGQAEKADVAERFWPLPDHEPRQARANLRQTLADLRRVLGPEADHLPTEYKTIRLDLLGVHSDLGVFRDNAGRDDDASLERAVGLYQKGVLLEGCLESWVGDERDRLELAYLDVLERLVARANADKDPAAAVRYLRRIVETDPFRETAQQALVVALQQSGDLAGALATYEDFRRLLRREFNTGPPPELVRVARALRAERERRGQRAHARAIQPSRRACAEDDVPAAFFGVPARNLLWVDRDGVFDRLSDLADRYGRVALSGMPGAGKTQIALEFAHRRRAQYRAVLWLRAGSYDACVSGIRGIARCFHLPAEREARDDAAVIQAVRAFLEERGGWLLVLDNADDLSLVRDFLPSGALGTVLLTTRAASCGSAAQALRIGPMTQAEGMDLLQRRAGDGVMEPQEHGRTDPATTPAVQHRALRTLCQRLYGLPLALDQAGAYLEETRITPRQYLDLYEERAFDLLAERGQDASEHAEPIATTLVLLLRHLETVNPAAADLLYGCAFLGADQAPPGTSTLPESLFRGAGAAWGDRLGAAASDTVAWNALLKSVFNCSLLDRDPAVPALVIHPLVQELLRSVPGPEERTVWARRASDAVARCFPEPEFRNWTACSQLLPHVHACARHAARFGLASRDLGLLFDRAGGYLWQRSRYEESERLYLLALGMLRASVPFDGPAVSHCLSDLATVYQQQGRTAEAAALIQEALDIGVAAWGPHHPWIAIYLNNLAGLKRDQGHYAEALPLYWQAIEITRCAALEGDGAGTGDQRLGDVGPAAREHLANLATYLNNVGIVLLKQSQPDVQGAVALFRLTLAVRQTLLGPEHPLTLQGLNNLAGACGLAGALEEPLALLHAACRAARAHPGLYAPVSLSWVYHNQANLYLRQGRYARSDARFRRALTIRRQELGAEHPLVADELQSYSRLLDATGRSDQAEAARREVAVIRERHRIRNEGGGADRKSD